MKKKKKKHVSHDVDDAVLVGITDVLQVRRVSGAAKQAHGPATTDTIWLSPAIQH